MRFLCFIVLFGVFSRVLLAEFKRAKQIAFTFDDAPRPATVLFDGPERASRLLQQLQKASIPQAAFFAVSERLNREGLTRLKTYAEAGHMIGNHTHSHHDFNNINFAEYVADFYKADALLSKLPGFTSWFRFPYLREGNDMQKRNGMRAKLDSLGYTNAYITVDNYDWEMDRLLQEGLEAGKTVDYDRLRSTYLDVLLACVDFYHKMAVTVLGR